jgi:hypothetical protein
LFHIQRESIRFSNSGQAFVLHHFLLSIFGNFRGTIPLPSWTAMI